MKDFQETDVRQYSDPFSDYRSENITCLREELEWSPLWYHIKGLMQTRSGYGNKLNSGYMIQFKGRKYRIYVTQWSNIGSCWFRAKGRRIHVSAH